MRSTTLVVITKRNTHRALSPARDWLRGPPRQSPASAETGNYCRGMFVCLQDPAATKHPTHNPELLLRARSRAPSIRRTHRAVCLRVRHLPRVCARLLIGLVSECLRNICACLHLCLCACAAEKWDRFDGNFKAKKSRKESSDLPHTEKTRSR